MRYCNAMYNKLFTKILDSSIWLEADYTRIVWLTLIATMDEDGFCQFASVANLAHRAIVPEDKAQQAVTVLESPDTNSSDPDHEGRRIERVPGGWMVLNSAKYRAMTTKLIIRENTRIRVARCREKKKQSVTESNADVTPCNALPKDVTPSVAVASAISTAEKPKPSSRVASRDKGMFELSYNSYPRHVGKRAASNAWHPAVGRVTLKSTEGIPTLSLQDYSEDFIYQRVMQYAAMCKRIGKEKQFIPHMATWLNQDRFMDDPSEWAVQENGHGKNQEGNQPRTAEAVSFTDKSCKRCSGSGFDVSSGKAARCECWLKNREAYAKTAVGSGTLIPDGAIGETGGGT